MSKNIGMTGPSSGFGAVARALDGDAIRRKRSVDHGRSVWLRRRVDWRHE